jgi:hypothetical protein
MFNILRSNLLSWIPTVWHKPIFQKISNLKSFEVATMWKEHMENQSKNTLK